MKPLAMGLMSGTSADGVSIALASFKEKTFKLIDYKTFPYQKETSNKILNASHLKVSEISSLNFQLGKIFANCSLSLLKRNGIKPEQVSVIGSHGQTIFHGPNQPTVSTLQIGEPAIIAEKTGITVVSDFRSRDIAASGEGAPLIPFFDHYFFGESTICAFQNIGGIANVTVVGKSVKQPIAFDTGPGNCLIDWAVKKISKNKIGFDKNGELASEGTIMMDVVRVMSGHSFFKKRPPKSTGKELFNEDFLPKILTSQIKKQPYNVLNTLTYFTAVTIAQSYKRFILPKFKLEEVVVSGGGALNKTLMTHLKNLLAPLPVNSIEKLGVHPQAKEPLAFAFFAGRAIEGKINHLPSGTGAKKACVLGKITPGKNFRGVR